MTKHDVWYKWLVMTILTLGLCSSSDFEHHDNNALERYLSNVNQKYGRITDLYSIGKSMNGSDLWVLAVGKSPFIRLPLMTHVILIGNMHGNEAVSREVLLHLAEHLAASYYTNTTINFFLNSTVIHILPSMNPDGYAASGEGDCGGTEGRDNFAGIDLNRNFPDPWFDTQTRPLAKETQLVMDWFETKNFVMSANLRGGVLAVHYPFDQFLNQSQVFGESVSPDDDTFRFLASTYASSNHMMASTNGGCDSDYFEKDITNDTDWYPIAGGMQNYNYLVHGIFGLTLDIACCKFPLASSLPDLWRANKDALVNFVFQAKRGVKGKVYDEVGATMTNVTLKIIGRESVPFKTRLYGEYFRVLLPGTYSMQATKEFYKPLLLTFNVNSERVLQLDFTMEPDQMSTTFSTSQTLPTSQQPPNSAAHVSQASFPLCVMFCLTLF